MNKVYQRVKEKTPIIFLLLHCLLEINYLLIFHLVWVVMFPLPVNSFVKYFSLQFPHGQSCCITYQSNFSLESFHKILYQVSRRLSRLPMWLVSREHLTMLSKGISSNSYLHWWVKQLVPMSSLEGCSEGLPDYQSHLTCGWKILKNLEHQFVAYRIF